MKRLWIGVTILLVLLALGIVTTHFTSHTTEEISEQLQLASGAVLLGHWEEAQTFSRRARAQWEAYHHWIAAVADHEPMEEIDDLFTQLEVYLQTRQQIPFSICCTSLSAMAKALGESHAVNWWSLL